MVKARKRPRTGPKVDDGRRCVVCYGGQETRQWRKVQWQGRESDACNACGLSYKSFSDKHGGKPTDCEIATWTAGRQGLGAVSPSPSPSSSTEVDVDVDIPPTPLTESDIELSWRLMRMLYSPTTPSSKSDSSFFKASPFEQTPPFLPFRSGANQAPPKPESKPKPADLIVDVDSSSEEQCPSDLCYLDEMSDSPLESDFEVTTPTSVSSFSCNGANASSHDIKQGGQTAYGQW